MTINVDTLLSKGLDSLVDIAAFSGAGYLSTNAVNSVAKLSIKSIFLDHTTPLKSAVACCALFVTIDRVVQELLNGYFRTNSANKNSSANRTFIASIRVAINLSAAVMLFNSSAETLKLAMLDYKHAAAIILTAIVIHAHFVFYFKQYNMRY